MYSISLVYVSFACFVPRRPKLRSYCFNSHGGRKLALVAKLIEKGIDMSADKIQLRSPLEVKLLVVRDVRGQQVVHDDEANMLAEGTAVAEVSKELWQEGTLVLEEVLFREGKERGKKREKEGVEEGVEEKME